MSLKSELERRSDGKCELCSSLDRVSSFEVIVELKENSEAHVMVCNQCKAQIIGEIEPDPQHWRLLNDSMWNEILAIKILSYNMLLRLKSEGWPADLLDMMYLTEEEMQYVEKEPTTDAIVHKDSNGHILEAGDSVVLIKDLKVKGANFIAKRGTAVRRIRLDPNNANHIEGKVDGQDIVILTEFVKKK